MGQQGAAEHPLEEAVKEFHGNFASPHLKADLEQQGQVDELTARGLAPAGEQEGSERPQADPGQPRSKPRLRDRRYGARWARCPPALAAPGVLLVARAAGALLLKIGR